MYLKQIYGMYKNVGNENNKGQLEQDGAVARILIL